MRFRKKKTHFVSPAPDDNKMVKAIWLQVLLEGVKKWFPYF